MKKKPILTHWSRERRQIYPSQVKTDQSKSDKTALKSNIAIIVSILSFVLGVLSITIVVLDFLDDHNYIELTQKEHKLDINVLDLGTIDDLMVYTILIRNSGDYSEDIIDISSFLELVHEPGKQGFLIDQDYCFTPLSLLPGEHKTITYTTRYDFREDDPVFDQKSAIIYPEIRVSIAGEAGLSTEYVKLGVMKWNSIAEGIGYDTDQKYKYTFYSTYKSLVFDKWKPSIVYTSYPKKKKWYRNKLCPDFSPKRG